MRFVKINIGTWPDVGWRLQWDIEGLTVSHEVCIERASSPAGPWEQVAVLPATSFGYEDSIAAWRGFNTMLFYRISVREISNPSNILLVSKPLDTQFPGSKITEEIIRQYELLLKGANTHPGYGAWDFACFKRSKFGSPCTECVDPYTGERGAHGKCSFCMGTGYAQGWSDPVVFRGRWMMPNPKATMIEVNGPSEEISRQLWTAGYPHIEPGDILVEKGRDICWRVRNVTASEPQRVIISQSMVVAAIDRQKIEGNLKFPEDPL